MNKKDRQKIFEKFKGHCAYCGDPLYKGWHVDEIQPCVRVYKIMPGYSTPTKYIFPKRVWTGEYEHPERLHFENQVPACPSCNINKHSGTLEDFRKLIEGFKKHLNEINTQYKISKRYGLVQEIDKPVVFYFETVKT